MISESEKKVEETVKTEERKEKTPLEREYQRMFKCSSHLFKYIRTLSQQPSLSLDDVAQVHRNLKRLERRYELLKEHLKEGHADHECFLKIKHLLRKAHSSMAFLMDKEVDKEIPASETGEIDLELFPEGLDKRLFPAYNHIKGITHALNDLKMRPMITHKELGHIQASLEHAENQFKKVKFTSEGEIPEGQAALSDMFEEVYEEVYDLVVLLPDELEEEPEVEESLAPLEHKLHHIIESLEELQSLPKDWVETRDIGKIQNKLHVIDEQYKDEKITRHGHIPGGQAIISELLEKAHELAHEIVLSIPSETETE
jgi:hypothetical protein